MGGGVSVAVVALQGGGIEKGVTAADVEKAVDGLEAQGSRICPVAPVPGAV